MNKQAAEKLATEYYTYGIELALNNAGLNKTAGIKDKLLNALGLVERSALPKAAPPPNKLLKALGLGGAAGAVGGGGYLMGNRMAPGAAELMAKMSPRQLVGEVGTMAKSRLGATDDAMRKIVQQTDNLETGLDSSHSIAENLISRLAMGQQAAKGIFTDPKNTFRALRGMGDELKDFYPFRPSTDRHLLTRGVPEVVPPGLNWQERSMDIVNKLPRLNLSDEASRYMNSSQPEALNNLIQKMQASSGLDLR
jgi:hypothetical protein